MEAVHESSKLLSTVFREDDGVIANPWGLTPNVVLILERGCNPISILDILNSSVITPEHSSFASINLGRRSLSLVVG